MKIFTIQFAFVAAILILTGGCSKQQFISPEEKLTGKWKFEKVTFQKQFSLCNKNISDKYNDVTIEFKNDKTVSYTETNSGMVYSGNFDLRTVNNMVSTYAVDDAVTQGVYELDLNLYSGTELKNFLGENVSVTSKKIYFTETKDDGIYSYHLLKL